MYMFITATYSPVIPAGGDHVVTIGEEVDSPMRHHSSKILGAAHPTGRVLVFVVTKICVDLAAVAAVIVPVKVMVVPVVTLVRFAVSPPVGGVGVGVWVAVGTRVFMGVGVDVKTGVGEGVPEFTRVGIGVTVLTGVGADVTLASKSKGLPV